MLRRLRIIALLSVLVFVAVGTWFDRVDSTSWRYALRVAVYPIAGDDSETSRRYVQGLRAADFRALEDFFEREAHEYGISLDRPVRVTLAAPLETRPPAIERSAGMLRVAAWSLHMRYWAWRAPDPAGPRPDVRLLVLYHDPARSPSLPHSLGLQKGLFGIVHVFADQRMAGSNDVVIAHELLHTLGATDKYSPDGNLPRHPDGYAEPEREPLHPQRFAELMGGRIPVTQTHAEIPRGLDEVLIGAATATEIGWLGTR